MQYGKAHREATLHPSEPGEAMSGRKTRRVEMEQLPDVCLRRRGFGKGELSGMAGQDNVFRLAVPLIPGVGMSGSELSYDQSQRGRLQLIYGLPHIRNPRMCGAPSS